MKLLLVTAAVCAIPITAVAVAVVIAVGRAARVIARVNRHLDEGRARLPPFMADQ